MSDSLLEDILARERQIAARVQEEKRQIREQLDVQQDALERKYAQLLRQLNARITSVMADEKARVENLCRQKERACRDLLSGHRDISKTGLATLVERELLSLLRGHDHDHPNGKG